MLKIFRRWGKMCDLFIAKQRDKKGFGFEFVRFEGVQNEKELKWKPD